MEALKQLHTSVAQTFENCFDTAYRDFNAELAAYDARVKDAEERAKAADEARQKTASEADVLRHEIFMLREEMRQNDIDLKECEEATERVLRLDKIYEPRRVLGDRDTERINIRYTELYEQAGTLVQASGKLKGLVKRHKTKLELLQSRLQRHEFTFIHEGKPVKFRRVEATGSMNPSVPSEFSPPTANPCKAPGRGLGTNMPPRKPVTLTSEVARDRDGSSTGDARGSASEERQRGEHPELLSTPSNASTNKLPPITPLASGEQVERLKRKRTDPEQSLPEGDSSTEISGRGYPEHSIMVKSETISSSPLRTYSPHPGPSGTQDLDDIGDIVVTPTKRIRFNRDQSLYAPLENLPTIMRLPSAQHMVRSNFKDRGIQFNRGSPRVLQPINGNLRNLSRSDQVPTAKRVTKDLRSITRISSITEDGDENRPPAFARRGGTNVVQSDQSLRDPSSRRRLSDLLEGTSPVSRMFQLGASTKASARTQSRTLRSSMRGSTLASRGDAGTTSTTIPTTSVSPLGNPKSSLQDGTAGIFRHQSGRKRQLEAIPDDKPYRARPPQRLGLEHFRINQHYNNGLDYAYDEVIRRKDERKCTSGCTHPGCCGEKFLAMARFGIPTDASGKTLSDNEILEEYLGGRENMINILSSENRENLLAEAKARVFADRFGRHRHQHHRPGTPPGFWRTEMPGTQELEDDREEAQRQEREKVKERYREAMRPGGRWIFADE
ncbi:DNA repair protein endonuclease SAE2/CtIP C-terminus-domain-containing protein [Aspergillus varians]